jgi:hypothetical protein
MATEIRLPAPNRKQARFLRARNKYICFGGARGGGKSWAVRVKALKLALRYPGIRMMIVRRTYPELLNNHVRPLCGMVPRSVAAYNKSERTLYFRNGSFIHFMYCASESDLDHNQGIEYEIIFIDEATQHEEIIFTKLTACLRTTGSYPVRMYLTCNPGGIGHGWVKRLFIDRSYKPGEDPEDYIFIQSLVTDNKALMRADPDYKRQLEALPPKLRRAWLEGKWDLFEGQVFEELRIDPNPGRTFTHVIEPFTPPRSWRRFRSYDWGYARPFSCGWWAVDHEGRLYRLLELYGCTDTPNEGVKWTTDEQFRKIAQIEREHPWLAGCEIEGVADPAIFAKDGGVSIAETAAKHGIYFSRGDNKRIPGWMQVHYRLRFDDNGIPMLYVFDCCKAFIRTMPLMMYSETKPEDIDTNLEDHCPDEVRYMCMSRPIAPIIKDEPQIIITDPLNQFSDKQRRRGYI